MDQQKSRNINIMKYFTDQNEVHANIFQQYSESIIAVLSNLQCL